MSREGIPDLITLSSSIIEIVKFIDNNKNMENIDKKKYLLENYPNVPASIIRLLTSSETEKQQAQNLQILLELLMDLQHVKEGKMDLEHCSKIFSDKLKKIFIDSVVTL